MLKIEDNRKVWISSDFHYNHKNICRGISQWKDNKGNVPKNSTRNFKTIDEMNETIVKNINNCVNKDDVLIFLGDFSFGGFEYIKKFREKIKCSEIHFVYGNHDHHIINNRENCQSLFKSCQWFLQLKYKNETIELFHYPILSHNSLTSGRIHLHGHSHLRNDKKIKYRRMDVGIDGHLEFRPYELYNEIIIPLKKNKIGHEYSNEEFSFKKWIYSLFSNF